MSGPATSAPSRRVLAIWLANLAIDRWRLTQPVEAGHGRPSAGAASLSTDAPLALIGETAHGPRITALNAHARAMNLATGMMLADARAICPEIAVCPSDPAGDLAFLEDMAIWAQRWGPWSAIDPPDGVIVDVTGAAHLFGGEKRLLADAAQTLYDRGMSVRLAIAPTAGAAWALAHHGPPGTIVADDEDLAARLSSLPVAALRLDEDVLVVLRRLGIKRLEDLAGIGRDALTRRFRNRRSPAASPLLRYDQLLGRVPEPILPVVADPPCTVQRRVVEPIRHLPLLETLVSDMMADMMRLLEGKGQGARRLELSCWRVDGGVVARHLEFAEATRDAAHACRLLAEKLEGMDAGFGIETARLTATWAEPLALTQRDLDEAAHDHGTSLAACLDRLSVRLGADAVLRPVARASHVPERAQGWQPPLAPLPLTNEPQPRGSRPLKLLSHAEEIAVLYATPDGLPRRFRWRGRLHEVAKVEGPERIAPEWWRERSGVRLRDYYRIEDASGRRYWIFRQGLAGDGRGGAPAWFLHGLFG